MSTITAIEAQIKIVEETLHNLYIKLQIAQEMPVREKRTKLKWISASNPETYRVAIVTKDGVLQVKSVTDGGGDCHCENCTCVPCWEYRNGAAWRSLPLNKVLFEDEMAWRETLPEGEITITPPRLSNKVLRALCMKPLEATTDALKLKELEERFPGATMVITTDQAQLEIEYMGCAEANQHRIFSNTNEIRHTFSDFGANGKPQLMAEWRGLYIDLSHLF
jgi:hypothetical protein